MEQEIAPTPVSAADSDSAPTLLLVDDEENILSALRRLFKPQGYRLLTATGGREGLEILERGTADMVISDMRMPEMTGAAFLEEVARQWPDTVRILLTGYADLSMTIDAINKGHIYRYISKPWEDHDIRLTVQHALEQQHLERERRRLEKLTHAQNRELKDLNAGLEDKVRARTAELQEMYDMVELAYKELKRSYVASIPVFANLVEMSERDARGHSRRVAEAARDLAREMKLEEQEVENIYFAGLLHDVGMLGMPEALAKKPYVSLSTSERRQYEKHPAMGQAALMALEPLQDAARLIRHHHERYDGRGYPDRLYGETIPRGARVLSVVSDFEALQLGNLLGEQLSEAEASGFLLSNRGQRYDPDVVDTFIAILRRRMDRVTYFAELKLTSGDLRPGMVLARDLHNEDGILLLTRGYHLTESVIEKIRNFERDEDKGLVVHVHAR